MNENDIKEKVIKETVIKIFAKIARVNESEVSESTSLRNSTFQNGLSLDFIEETMAICGIEKSFGITLHDNFMDDFSTVGDVIDNLKKQLKIIE